MAKIAFFDIKPWEIKYLKKELKEHDLLFFEEKINNVNLSKAKNADIISIFIYSKVNADILKKLTNLKMITTRSTGFDHIDIKETKEKKIPVCNVPYYGENTVAEHTFALIMSLSRNVHKSYVRTLKNDFSIEGLTGFDLKGKTIGIIGGGHIGLNVAKIAKGFGMNVLVYDLYKQVFLSEVMCFEYTSFEDLLKKSDIISLHVPYNKNTHHMINKETIHQIKKGAILINTARGQIVDTDALLYALENKILSGAGIDVIEGEDLITEEKQLLHEDNVDKWKTILRDHRIFKMDNVVFTLHNAFNSKEALIRILDTTIENIEFYCNKKHINLVND
ncbi:MAG: hydroxyacid dehydrogenase [Candidatus Aenigmarchaeota archaeon]|nr:hydroxyacid dehydrogenase [Candidatus Aenigmarchaeota archaeon]